MTKLSNAITAFLVAALLENTAAALPLGDCERLLIGESVRLDQSEGEVRAQLAARRALNLALESWEGDPRKLKEVIERASANLEAQGVHHRVTRVSKTVWTIEIEPQRANGSRLNVIAASLWEKYGTKVVFNPKKLKDRKSLATYVRPDPAEGRDHGTLHLPTASIVDPDGLDLSLLHEIVHSNTIRRRARGEPFEFYGRVAALKKKGGTDRDLPGSTLYSRDGKALAAKGYQHYFAFDEIEAYYVQVRGTMHKIDKRPRQDLGPELFKRTRTRALRGLRLALQANRFAQAALEALAAGGEAAEFVLLEGYPHGRLTLSVEGTRLGLRLPLIGSHGEADPANPALLAHQLESLLSGSRERALQFYELLGRLDPKTAAKLDSPAKQLH